MMTLLKICILWLSLTTKVSPSSAADPIGKCQLPVHVASSSSTLISLSLSLFISNNYHKAASLHVPNLVFIQKPYLVPIHIPSSPPPPTCFGEQARRLTGLVCWWAIWVVGKQRNTLSCPTKYKKSFCTKQFYYSDDFNWIINLEDALFSRWFLHVHITH